MFDIVSDCSRSNYIVNYLIKKKLISNIFNINFKHCPNCYKIEQINTIKTNKRGKFLLSFINNKIIIKKKIINKYKIAINVHFGLLPKYAGFNAFQNEIANGEKFSGISIHHMTDIIDGGNIIDQKKIRICKDDNAGSLLIKLNILNNSFLKKIIKKILYKKKLPSKKQNQNQRKYILKKEVENYRVKLNDNYLNIDNFLKSKNFSPFKNLKKPYIILNKKKYIVNNYTIINNKTKLDKNKFTIKKKDNLIIYSLGNHIIKFFTA